MLAKRVIGKQNLLVFQISSHRIRPVQHRQRHKPERVFPQRKRIAVFHHLKIEFPAEIFDGFTPPLFRNDDFRLRRHIHERRQSAAVIRFHMVYNHVVDLRRVDDLTDPFQQFFGERRFHGIDQANLFIDDKIGVVRYSARCLIAVKVAVGPIHRPHLVYSFGKLCIKHRH